MAGVESWSLNFLVNAAWQVPLLALVAAGLAALMRRAQARFIFGLWLGALALAVVVPVGSSFWVRARPGTLVAIDGAPEAFPAMPARHSVSEPAGPVKALASVREAVTSTISNSLARGLLTAWALSCVWSAVGLLRASLGAARLRAAAWPLPDEVAHRLAVDIVGSSRPEGASDATAPHMAQAELLATDAAVGPLTLGLFRPAILLPRRWLEAADQPQLEGVLAHELAHVERRDLLLHLFTRLLLIPVAFHPAAHWLVRRLAAVRELACDELAAARTGRLSYARALLSAAARIANSPRPATALGMFDSELLEVRMRRLIDDAPRWNPRRSLAVLAIAATALAVVAGAAGAGALAVSAAGAPAAGAQRFAGIWRGLYDEGAGRRLPGATLTVAILDGQPRAALLMNRHLAKPDGTMTSTATGLPIVEQRIDGDSLVLRTREDGFRFRGGPPASVDIQWRFTLTGADAGELEVLANSYFVPAKARGESVPPPPPPMAMRREAVASQGGAVQK